MRRQFSGWCRLAPASLLLVVLIALGMAVTGCSDSSSNPTSTQQSGNSGVIRGGVNPGEIAFEYRVAAAGDPENPIEGPFAIRGRNIRYDSGALKVDLSVVNLSDNTHTGPITLTFLSLLPDGVTIGNPQAEQHGAGATLAFEFEDGDDMWAPNEESLSRPTYFVVGQGVSIGFVAQLNGGGSGDGMGAIGGMVWNDANGDGIMDTTESPVDGATISLEAEGMETQMATSGADGLYRFEGLAAGFYTVQKIADSGSVVTSGNPIYVTLVESEGVVSSFLAANFGCQFTGGESASISGTVFQDANQNGMKDDGETGVGGAEVQLSGADSLSEVALSDSGGAYYFTLTGAGVYTVTLSAMEGYTSTSPDSVTVEVGESEAVVVNFGVITEGTGDSSHSVSGRAFEDLNNNHVFDDGEPGLEGVGIKLCLWQGCNPEPAPTPHEMDCQSTETDADGLFLFENLEEGIYFATSEKPEGFERTTWRWVVVKVGAESTCGAVNFGFITDDSNDDCDDGHGKKHKHHGHDDDDDDDDDDGGGEGIASAMQRAGLSN
jgi:hypothetical protein